MRAGVETRPSIDAESPFRQDGDDAAVGVDADGLAGLDDLGGGTDVDDGRDAVLAGDDQSMSARRYSCDEGRTFEFAVQIVQLGGQGNALLAAIAQGFRDSWGKGRWQSHQRI